MSKKAVVYGAGQSGRGYAARFLKESGYTITFIEKNEKLINLLNEDQQFSIHFYDQQRTPVVIDNVTAHALSEDLSALLTEADLILTSVGEEHLEEVAQSIAQHIGSNQVPQLLTCENGINPAKVLKNALKKRMNLTDDQLNVSQTAIFCSTVNVAGTRLDILSQDETYFPYDSEGFKGELDFPGAEPIEKFEEFLKRKIYTYNCLAGLISYFGYVKGYTIYSEAANDEEISELMDRLLKDLNPSLADYFGIDENSQKAFAEKAVAKFKDADILDYVIKNGRAARRKLGKTERIYAPYTIIADWNGDTNILTFVAGAALIYLEELENDGEPLDPVAELSALLELPESADFIQAADSAYQKIKLNRKNVQLLELIGEQSE